MHFIVFLINTEHDFITIMGYQPKCGFVDLSIYTAAFEKTLF